MRENTLREHLGNLVAPMHAASIAYTETVEHGCYQGMVRSITGTIGYEW